MNQPAVYILANKKNGTLYTGVTSNLIKRVWEHKQRYVIGFAEKYHCILLVFYELCDEMAGAIHREKQLKAGSRKKKIELIEAVNPTWEDLYDSII